MQCPMGRIVGAWSCVQVFAKKFDASFASTPHIFIFEASFCEFLFYHTKFAISLHVLSLFSFLYNIYGHISSNNAKECGINTNFIFACENFSFRVFFSNFSPIPNLKVQNKNYKIINWIVLIWSRNWFYLIKLYCICCRSKNVRKWRGGSIHGSNAIFTDHYIWIHLHTNF